MTAGGATAAATRASALREAALLPHAAEASAEAFGAAFAEAEAFDVTALRSLGPAMVFAPHADDESLGCGGLLAMLAEAGVSVRAALMTDGAASHPGSRRFDAAARTAIRAAEWRDALARLGVADARGGEAVGLGLPDGAVPGPGEAGFESACDRCGTLLAEVRPGLLLLPWRRDPHPDHRATHALVAAALRACGAAPRCLEYMVWAAERAAPADLPLPREGRAWRLAIGPVLARKRAAIAAHRSQHGLVITDDPGGFTIDPAMRRRAEQPFEYFFEAFAA